MRSACRRGPCGRLLCWAVGSRTLCARPLARSRAGRGAAGWPRLPAGGLRCTALTLGRARSSWLWERPKSLPEAPDSCDPEPGAAWRQEEKGHGRAAHGLQIPWGAVSRAPRASPCLPVSTPSPIHVRPLGVGCPLGLPVGRWCGHFAEMSTADFGPAAPQVFNF